MGDYQYSRGDHNKPVLTLGGMVKLWPTPTEACATGGQTSRSGKRKGELLLAGAVKMWPTPKASAAGPDFAKMDRSATGISLQTAVMLPTPAARDYRSPNKNGNMQDQLPNVIGGSLNPDWVCWLMGWPCGWTALGPLNPQAFREWLQAFKTGWQG